MKNLYTQDQISEMRKRLYDRGAKIEEAVRHELSDNQIPVSRNWVLPEKIRAKTSDLRASMLKDAVYQEAPYVLPVPAPVKPKRGYRIFVLAGSLLIFIVVALFTSLYLFFGGNQISSQNIAIEIKGPASVGGGETIASQVVVHNTNKVPIESVTLIIKYPVGTRSVGDSPRNLFEERIPIPNIASGEVRNIPFSVAIFGEEASEKSISATVEYRISGSSGTFFKESEPLKIQIVSSPLVLRVENVEKVASGQLVELTIKAVSNASAPLSDVLITADFPNSFKFENSDPEPVFGDNVWRIKEILPEQAVPIKIKGTVIGLTDESFRINLKAGSAQPDNQYIVSSILAEARADFTIERPFIDVAIKINGEKEAILPQGSASNVSINIKNTLGEAVYDMVVELVPKGNAINVNNINSGQGYFDSNTNSIRWEVSNNPSFERLLPGDSRSLGFTINSDSPRTTASFDLVANVYARRVAESNAQENLVGSAGASAKYSSIANLGSQAGRNVGRFGDSGPIPPKVGEVTTYTLTLVAEAGFNDMANAVVETKFPIHVDWLEEYDGPGKIIYNPISKGLIWEIGDIKAFEKKTLLFQVSTRPSLSLAASTPVLMDRQTLQATDRFTEVTLQKDSPAVTTELSTEMGFPKENGRVQP